MRSCHATINRLERIPKEQSLFISPATMQSFKSEPCTLLLHTLLQTLLTSAANAAAHAAAARAAFTRCLAAHPLRPETQLQVLAACLLLLPPHAACLQAQANHHLHASPALA
jgi:hypothetical protein